MGFPGSASPLLGLFLLLHHLLLVEPDQLLPLSLGLHSPGVFRLGFVHEGDHEFVREPVLLLDHSHVLGRCLLQPGDHVLLDHLHVESVVEVADISQQSVAVGFQVLSVKLGELPADDLAVGVDLVFLLFALVLLAAFELLLFAQFRLLHALGFQVLGILDFLEVLLLFPHDAQFFLFKHFHPGGFQGLAAEHGEDGLHVSVEEEELVVFHAGLGVAASLHGYATW